MASYNVMSMLLLLTIAVQFQTSQSDNFNLPSGYESQLNQKLPEELDFYSFFAFDILDDIVSLEKYRGKVSLVVNVASECGYTTNHYKALTLLQQIFGETGKFNVLAFPCNQFGNQEPGTRHQIYEFVYNTMGASFPVFSKVHVVGDDTPPAWNYLIKHSGKVPTWNFWKYLVDHKGYVLGAWGPSVSPEQLYQNIKDAINNIETEDDENNNNKKKNAGHKDEF